MLIQLLTPPLERMRISWTGIDQIKHLEQQQPVLWLGEQLLPQYYNEEEPHLLLALHKLFQPTRLLKPYSYFHLQSITK